MPHDVIMPALGMAQDTGVIVVWHKQPGDAVTAGDVLFEVETDKATMEVEAQGDGFLTDVRAQAGQEVPVGHVIARIAESAESSMKGTGPEPARGADHSPAEADELPKGRTVIMPTLGMAQDSGLLIRWLKTPGDAVKADDPLFEVETDKSAVEVNAGHDGFLAATLAEEGDAVPVGQTIAVISDDKPANPVIRSAGTGQAAEPAPDLSSASSTGQAPAARSTAAPGRSAPRPTPGGRILASPKARRLALEQGLDLGRLVAAGHPQPYHARDIDALKALPDAVQQHAPPPARRLTAEIARDGFAEFAAWAAKEAGVTDSDALLAGLAAASLGREDAIVNVQAFERDRLFAADGHAAVARPVKDGEPDLVVRDLRFTRVTGVAVGPEDWPVLTLAAHGSGFSVTLECAAGHMTASGAIALLSAFAGRMDQPLRHLL